MHALARVVSIRHKIDKSEADQYIFRKFCTHVHEPFSAHLSKEKILKVPLELKINRGAHIIFLSYRGILMHCMGTR